MGVVVTQPYFIVAIAYLTRPRIIASFSSQKLQEKVETLEGN